MRPAAAFRADDARSHHRSDLGGLTCGIGDGVQKSVDARIEPLANLITIVAANTGIPGNTPPKNLIDADVAALQKASDVLAATR